MRKNGIIIIIVILIAGIITFLVLTAQIARKESDNILKEFNRVNDSLIESNDSLTTDNKKGVGAVQRDSARNNK